jgi:hypothetical protein
MPSTKTRSGRVTEDQAAWQSVAKDKPIPSASNSGRTNPPLLVQIPDLNESAEDPPAKESDGRVLSQEFSNKLVIGLGVVLVLVAILPWAMKKTSRRPGATSAPAAKSDALAFTSGPTASGGQAGPLTAGNTPAVLTPQPDGPGASRAPSDPAWQAGAQQADRRNDPATAHREYGSGNPLSANPLVPPAGAAAAPPADPQAGYEPGVARLEGTIESPPIRTTERGGETR